MMRYPQVPFLEAVRDATGGNPKVQQRHYLPDGPVPILDQGQDFIAGYTTTENAYTGQLPVVLFGDHTRTFKYVDFPFALGADGVKVLVPQEGFTASFLYWHFRVADIPNAGYSRHFKFLREISICKPPLLEQRRIVGILNRAAKIERLRARAQERLKEFIPALFLKMFGDPIENPMGWEMVPLGESCCITGGGTPRRNNASYFGGKIPWATPTDVTAQDSLSIDTTKETITETGLQSSSARLVPAGTVLMTSRATIGYTVIATTPITTNQGFINLTCGNRLCPEYLAFCLSTQRERLVRLASGTTFKELAKSTLKKLAAPAPPLARQREFATIVWQVEGAAAYSRHAADVAATTSTSLMSRLLEASA